MRLKEFLENKIHNKEIVWDNKSQLIKFEDPPMNLIFEAFLEFN